MTTAYPLQWPLSWPRSQRKVRAQFQTAWGAAIGHLLNELKLMRASNIVISSNLPLRRDGLPYANVSQPEDVGVVAYFTWKGQQQCIPCDRWDRVEHNIRAIGLTVQALRGLERWGAKEMVDAAFRGFTALPAPEQVTSSSVQYFADCSDKEMARQRYLRLAKDLHPDVGGDVVEFQEMKRQYEAIR